MDFKQAMGALKRAGTAQNRKVYARHGATGEVFGVSYALLGRIKKAIMVDQALAEQLWASGNHDARVLATMVSDSATITAKALDTWARQADNYILADAVGRVASKSRPGHARMRKWMGAKREWPSTIGWNVLTHRCMEDEALTDDELLADLATIETRIHGAPNRTRYSMNNALIAIGVRNAKLKKAAQATAKRVGEVHVDHGETGCKTPAAVGYIEKAYAHAQRKKAGAKTAKVGAQRKKAGAKTGKAGAQRKKAGAKATKAGAQRKKAGAKTGKAGAQRKKAATRVARPQRVAAAKATRRRGNDT